MVRAMAGEPLVDIKKLKRAVEASIKPHGPMSPRRLSLIASDGKNPDLVRDLLFRGRGDKLVSYPTVVGFASALNVEPGEFLLAGAASEAVEEISVIGVVQAGAWRERAQWDVDEWYPIEVEPSPIPGVERFGLEVVGYSMEKEIPPGSILECMRVFDNGDLQPVDGDYVVVERRRSSLVETTCKRLEICEGGIFKLHAESNRPEFAEPIVITPSAGETDDETVIVAIVDKATKSFFRRRPLRRG